MSIPPESLAASNTSTRFLPAELFYPICSYVSSRRDLHTLATTSRVLQRPSEASLHRKVVMDSREMGWRFVRTVEECPRFMPLVRELELQSVPSSRQSGNSVDYWERMRDILGSLSALERLDIDDGRDQPLSWILSKLPPNRLRILRCTFVLDVELLRVLQGQSVLEELTWRGGLVALPSSTSTSVHMHVVTQNDTPRVAEAEPGDNPNSLFSDSSSPDPDELLVPVIRQFLPSFALPNLKYLTSDSLSFARALVPGRAITHLWIPGSMHTAAVASSFTYRHIYSSDSGPTTVPVSSSTHPIQLSNSRWELSSTQWLERLCRAIREFKRSRGPVLSLRMPLDLGRLELNDVLGCIANNLPELRCLGFLPGHFLDRPEEDESTSKLVDGEVDAILPPFKCLHTICLWSVPSRRGVSSLESTPKLPVLRTIACLHYSTAFEWLCLPVRDSDDEDYSDSPGSFKYECGIEWNYEGGNEGRIGGVGSGTTSRRRRVTPVHDPGNLLWRDV